MAELTLLQLTEQVQRLTQRVAALEREFAGHRPITHRETVLPTPEKEPAPPPVSQPVSAPSLMPTQPVPVAKPETHDLEANLGLRLVNRVGAVTLILGIAFFFRYAVENNWIGEWARVLFGALAGLLMLAGGEWAFRRGQRIFAQGITGAGAAALFLSFYSAFAAYHLVPLTVALALTVATAALAGYLALRYQSQAIAVLALFGGFLAPYVLEGKSLGPWFLPFYVAFLDGGVLYLAGKRSWRPTEWAALAGTFLYTSQIADNPLRALMPVYYLLFATRPSKGLFLATHLMVLAEESLLPGLFWEHSAGLLGVSLAGLAVLRRRGWYEFSAVLLSAAGCCWFAMESSGKSPMSGGLATVSLLFGIFLTITIWRASVSAAEHLQNSAEIAALVINPALFFIAVYWKLQGWGDSWLAALALFLAALYFGLAYRWRERPAPNTLAIVSAGIAIAFFTLAIPIEFHAFRITMAWGLEGAALVWIAVRRGVATMRAFGLFVLVIAGLHFLAEDLTIYARATDHAALANARLATTLVLAAAFFLAAWWSRGTPVPAWLPGLGGHLVLLSGLSFEVIDWAARYHPANQASAESAGISVLFAAYAVVLVGIGARLASAGSRYLGLVLIAIVVVKLYLYDVWQLEVVYRFVAFAVLGALLLLVSFLYSRYRESVATWLTADVKPHGASEAHPPPQQE